MTKEKIWTKNFISISLVNLFVFTTFYALLTTLPLYVMEEWGVTEAKGGLVVTVMLLAAIVIRPLSGNILSRFGKRKMLILTVILFALSVIVYVFIQNFTGLLVLRFWHGIPFAILTTATSALAADIVPKTRRGEGLGYFTMSMNLAIVIGPFLGLTLTQFVTYKTMVIILNIFTIISVFLALLVKDHHKASKDIEMKEEKLTKKLSLQDLFEKNALSTSFIGLLISFAYSSIISYISVYANDLGLSSASSYFFLVFALMMLISRPYLGRWFDTYGALPVIIPCMILFALGFVGLSLSTTATLFLISAGVIGIGYGSLLPFMLSVVVERSPSHRSGHATATFFTLYDSGIALGSFLLGIIVAHTGFVNLFFLLAGFVIMVTFLFLLLFKKQPKVS
ncbi:MFS transporter [Gracilibacillus dipsosauri]|uniref:MFS transporter n=1 Tax=Gracilibacillus dipsosauri TaxID=178340 RepID=A0A317KXC9_9BACI|nr:MFS transporter [Gracilibacillus dipsosauri]PWU68135.1 MFS transporter [Gracilibacillus dipsosauri]